MSSCDSAIHALKIVLMITELRKNKGWNQTELAKKSGVPYTQMSRYEVKGVQPPANTLKKAGRCF